MGVAIVTGSAGLIGSEAVRYFAALGLDIIGIDNDMRGQFFGDEASTRWVRHGPKGTFQYDRKSFPEESMGRSLDL